jgi:hypothetical protein
VIEYEADGCYLANLKDAELAASIKVNWANWVRTCFCEVLTAVTAFHLETTGQPEWKIGHEVTVYESSTIAAQVKAVIHFYPHLWEDCSNVMKVSEKEWMNILLIDDWEAKYKPEQAHVYLISQNDWEVINKAFDKLQLQEHLKWTKPQHLLPFSVLLCEKLTNETRKERVVIDIWALNKITMSDAYSVSSQADILTAVHGVNFIFTVDCSVFFYQWRVKRHTDTDSLLSHIEDRRLSKSLLWDIGILQPTYKEWLIEYCKGKGPMQELTLMTLSSSQTH